MSRPIFILPSKLSPPSSPLAHPTLKTPSLYLTGPDTPPPPSTSFSPSLSPPSSGLHTKPYYAAGLGCQNRPLPPLYRIPVSHTNCTRRTIEELLITCANMYKQVWLQNADLFSTVLKSSEPCEQQYIIKNTCTWMTALSQQAFNFLHFVPSIKEREELLWIKIDFYCQVKLFLFWV